MQVTAKEDACEGALINTFDSSTSTSRYNYILKPPFLLKLSSVNIFSTVLLNMKVVRPCPDVILCDFVSRIPEHIRHLVTVNYAIIRFPAMKDCIHENKYVLCQ